MTHLRRYLEEHGMLYPEQLAEATRRQQIYGGSLDTVLLELELLDPVTLGEMLERACGFPVAPSALLDNGLERPWNEIPEQMQRSRWVEPLARDGEEVLVGVHPDLPNELLGQLMRSVGRMRPFVTPECCLEKVAAERHHSVVPQRYAVLCAAYLSAVKRRPSVSGVYEHPTETEQDAPVRTHRTAPPVAIPQPTGADDTEPVDLGSVAGTIDVRDPAPVSLPAARTGATVVPTGPPLDDPAPHVEDVPTSDTPTAEVAVVTGDRTTVEMPAMTGGPPAAEVAAATGDRSTVEMPAMADGPPAAEGLAAVDGPVATQRPATADRPTTDKVPVVSDRPTTDRLPVVSDRPTTDRLPVVAGEPPTAEPAEPTEPEAQPALVTPPARDHADIDRRMQQAHGALEATRTRDEALQAIVSAAMVLSPRVGLFRVRGSELVGLSTPASALPDPGGKVVDSPEDSAPATALAEGTYHGPATEADLCLATGAQAHTPCVLQRVEVRGRPIVVVYLDRDGAPIDDHDLDTIASLAGLAANVFEKILKLRRHSGPTAASKPSTSTAQALTTRPGDTWGPVPEPVRAAYGDRDGDPDIEPSSIEPPARSRATTPDAEHGPGAGPPPPAVPPDMDPPQPGDWRLTPDLAAQALDERASNEAPPDVDPAPPGLDAPVADLEPSGLDAPPDADPSTPRLDASVAAPEPGDETTDTSPAATLDTPAAPSHDDITQVGPAPTAPPGAHTEPTDSEATAAAAPPAANQAVAFSDRPTVQHPGHDPDSEPPDGNEAESSLPRETMHSVPPPPPLPPPPPSAVEDEAPDGTPRRPRSPTIHGLPPPEPRRPTDGITKRYAPLVDAPDDEDQEVTIIPLAQPIMPATARGRIQLEEEDWMPPASPLAPTAEHEAIDALVDAVVAGEANAEELLEHGNAAMVRLMAQFPGPLEVLRRDLHSLPPPSAHGPLVRTVIALQATIVPHVIDLFEHPNPDVRFYAAFVFHELRDPRCMRPLARLGFDANGDVRVVTMRVLETYRRSEGYESAAAVVRTRLADASRTEQLHAARAAGTLRDIGAIPQLIDLLASGDRFIQEASLESLCSITGQQHGLKPHRWRAWHDAHGQDHRIEWIIESLRHRDIPVRRWAADELVRVTGHRVPFSPMGDRRAREVAAKAWTNWWQDRGRSMFGA